MTNMFLLDIGRLSGEKTRDSNAALYCVGKQHSVHRGGTLGVCMAKSRLKPSSVRIVARGSLTGAAKARAAMFRDVVTLFYATTGRLRSLKRLVASSVGLNSADYSIVAALYRLNTEQGVRIREIAEYLHLSPENVTTAVHRLVSQKWVVKSDHPSDARAVTLKLSAVARRRIDALTTELREINDIWFKEMSTAQIQQLIEYLEAILDGFDAAHEKAKEKFLSKNRSWAID
jgi:DNA-binding MarR family transcriptional regulator